MDVGWWRERMDRAQSRVVLSWIPRVSPWSPGRSLGRAIPTVEIAAAPRQP
jgi:hypothetical protein